MITSYEVGAVFKLVDQASPTLRLLADQFKAFDSLIKKTQASLTAFGNIKMPGLLNELKLIVDGTKAITDQSVLARDALGTLRLPRGTNAGLTRMEQRLGAITTQANAAAAALGRVSALPAIGGGGGRAVTPGGGAGGGTTPGGPHFGRVSTALPGGSHFSIPGGAGMAGAAALGFGVWEAAKMDSTINRIMMTGGSGVGQTADIKSNPNYAALRSAIIESYQMTGLPLEQIEEAILSGTRGLAGVPFAERLKVMPQLLRSASTESYLKEGTSLKEAMEAFVGLGHMTGQYTPEKLGALSEQFAYLSTTTPSSVKELTTAAGYAIPMLRTADFDPAQLLLMLTSQERGGIRGTKAGTWIGQLGMQSFPGTSLMSKMMFKKHESALRDLGLIDENEKPTWFTDGKPDLVKMTGIAGEHIQAMDPAHRLAIEKALWGQQGGRAAAFFADPTSRAIMANVANEQKLFPGGEAQWKQAQANDPMIQMRRTWATFNTVLIDLGSTVLPPVVKGLEALDSVLKAISGSVSWVDKLLGHSPQSDALMNEGFGGHVTRLFNDLFGGKPTAPKGVPLLKGLVPAPRDFTDPDVISPGGSLKAGGWGDIGAAMSSAVIHDGVLQALVDWSNGSGGGAGLGGGGGGGLGGFGGRYGHGMGGGRRGGGVGPTNVGWTAGGSTPAERAAFIRHTAASLGVDPTVALRVAQSEGFYKFTGDHGMSHGDFQLYDGGGLGNVFRKLHPGINPADPKNWKIADQFALEWAAKHGWRDWHGAKRVGIGYQQGIGTYHGAIPPLLGGIAGGSTRSFGSPFSNYSGMGFNAGSTSGPSKFGFGPMGMQSAPVHVNTHVHLDGEKISKRVSHHQTKHSWAPRQAPYHNSYARPTSPDIGFETG